MARLDEVTLAGLMRQANGGDAAAYARFLRAVLPVLRQIARDELGRVGGAPQDDDDVAQEAILAIHIKRHTWREDEPISPWLRAITRYKAIDQVRRRKRRGIVNVEIDAAVETLVAPSEPDPTLRTDMERCLEQLTGKSGVIVRAIGIDGEEISEVAKRMEMSNGAVRVALHRGLQKLATIRLRQVD